MIQAWRSGASCRNSAAALLLLLLLGLSGTAGSAVLTGKVIGAISRLPVDDVTVTADAGGRVIGSGSTRDGGLYSFLADTAGVDAITLKFEHPAFKSPVETVPLDQGEPLEPFLTVELQRNWAHKCPRVRENRIILGKFNAPFEDEQRVEGLMINLRRAIFFGLTEALQKQNPRLFEYFPKVSFCKDADEGLDLGKQYTAFFGADVFVSGGLSKDNPEDSSSTIRDIEMYLFDAYSEFPFPNIVQSENVDLNRPLQAGLSDQVYGQLFLSVAAGYKKEGFCEAGIVLFRLAESRLGELPPAMQQQLDECLATLEHSALLLDRQ